MDRKIRNIQKKIRKMSWHQKLILLDWINAWYSDYKQEQKLAQEEYYRMLEEEE